MVFRYLSFFLLYINIKIGKIVVSWPTFFPLMFGVQYLNYYQITASYQEGEASDSHSLTLSEN